MWGHAVFNEDGDGILVGMLNGETTFTEGASANTSPDNMEVHFIANLTSEKFEPEPQGELH